MGKYQKHVITFGLVIGGVIGAGYVMSKFRSNEYIAEARNGFQGII